MIPCAARVYLSKDELAQWTMGRLASLASPPGHIPGDSTRGKESGCEHVSVLRIDLPSDAQSKGALLEVT